jgi:hypothetical protein
MRWMGGSELNLLFCCDGFHERVMDGMGEMSNYWSLEASDSSREYYSALLRTWNVDILRA